MLNCSLTPCLQFLFSWILMAALNAGIVQPLRHSGYPEGRQPASFLSHAESIGLAKTLILRSVRCQNERNCRAADCASLRMGRNAFWGSLFAGLERSRVIMLN